MGNKYAECYKETWAELKNIKTGWHQFEDYISCGCLLFFTKLNQQQYFCLRASLRELFQVGFGSGEVEIIIF